MDAGPRALSFSQVIRSTGNRSGGRAAQGRDTVRMSRSDLTSAAQAVSPVEKKAKEIGKGEQLVISRRSE